MVPLKWLPFEKEGGHYRKYCEADNLLDYFQLNEGVRTSVILEADSVGWNLKAILEEGDAP